MNESLYGTPQDVYARHLCSRRGYPLWMPELKTQLPKEYQEHGLKVGDVGYVVPEQGCFEVLFNICLPLSHDLHRNKQLPRNFQPITLEDVDIATYLGVDATGSVIKTSSVTTVEISPDGQPSDYSFTFSSSEGALLVLPQGANQHSLRRTRSFGLYAKQHALEWYRFVEEDLEQMISNDSLYLITGFYKSRSWALAAFGEAEGSENIPARFKIKQSEGEAIARGYNWSTTRHSESRVGPEVYNGNANQAVYISGFKVAVRDEPVARKQIMVKADHPSVEPRREEFSDTVDSQETNETESDKPGESTCTTGGKATDSDGQHVIRHASFHHMPHVSQPFHPSNIVNRYLLEKKSSATVAVTHDSQWATFLKSAGGGLESYELVDERLIIKALAETHVIALEEGAVFLKSGEDIIEEFEQSLLAATCQLDPTLYDFASSSHGIPSWDDENYSLSLTQEATSSSSKESHSQMITLSSSLGMADSGDSGPGTKPTEISTGNDNYILPAYDTLFGTTNPTANLEPSRSTRLRHNPRQVAIHGQRSTTPISSLRKPYVSSGIKDCILDSSSDSSSSSDATPVASPIRRPKDLTQPVDVIVATIEPPQISIPRDPPPTVECRWVRESGSICGYSLTRETLANHLRKDHDMWRVGSKNKNRCEWEGCGKDMGWRSLRLHVDWVHIRNRREPR